MTRSWPLDRATRKVGAAATVVFVVAAWSTVFLLARTQIDSVLFIGLAGLVAAFFLFGCVLLAEFRARPVVFLYAMVVAFSLQNVFLGFVVGEQLIRTQGQVLIGLKTLYVAMLCLVVAGIWVVRPRRVRFTAVDIAGFLMVAYVGISFFVSDYPMMARVTNVRQFVVPILMYLCARFLPVDQDDLNGFLGFLVGFGVLLAVLGFIERFLIDDRTLFELGNMSKVTLAKIGRDEIPGTLWTNLGPIQEMRRLISVFYEPINAGYFFGAITLVAAIRRNVLIAIVAGVATFLTFAKAAWAIVAAGFAVFVIEAIPNRAARLVGYVLVGLGYATGVYLTAVVFPSSTTVHLFGLVSGVAAAIAEPLGHGIGSGGYFSWIFGVSADPVAARAFGSDSGIGSIGQQLGIVGIVLYLLWLGLLLIALGKAYHRLAAGRDRRDPLRNTALIALALAVGLFLNVFLQENALSIYANYITVTLAGITVALSQNLAFGGQPKSP